jgi:hypothetical protein
MFRWIKCSQPEKSIFSEKFVLKWQAIVSFDNGGFSKVGVRKLWPKADKSLRMLKLFIFYHSFVHSKNGNNKCFILFFTAVHLFKKICFMQLYLTAHMFGSLQ